MLFVLHKEKREKEDPSLVMGGGVAVIDGVWVCGLVLGQKERVQRELREER